MCLTDPIVAITHTWCCMVEQVEHCSLATYVSCINTYKGTVKLTCATNGGDFALEGASVDTCVLLAMTVSLCQRFS